MSKHIRGLIRLARYREYVFFVIVTTLLGAAAAHASLGWPLLGVLVANWLAVGYAFMINDVEDAPDDALNPAKVNRNPVSAGDLTVPAAQRASYAVAAAAAATYALLGPMPLAIGLCCLVLGHLYSWRVVRLKTKPGLDLLSHGLMLAGLQFLAAYYAFVTRSDWRWMFPFALIVAVSLYGELFNELRDLDGDRRAGVSHTASVLGPRWTYGLMWLLLAVGVASAVGTIFLSGLFPIWVLRVLAILELVFVLPAIWKARHSRSATELHQPFHMPVQTAGALTMVIWFVWPWVDGFLQVDRILTFVRPWLVTVWR